MRQSFDLMIYFIVADLDIFRVSDLVEQEGSLDLLDGLVALSSAQAAKVHFFHVFGAHTLGGESAQAAFQANVNLVFHQSFRNREVIALYQFSEKFVLSFMFGAMLFISFGAFADPFLD